MTFTPHKLKLILSLAVYALLIFIQLKISSDPNFNAVLTQFQVLICVYLTIEFDEIGYSIALFINLLTILISGSLFVIYSHTFYFPGIAFPLFTIIIISIIFSFKNQLNNKIIEITLKNNNLKELNQKIVTAHEELEQQNELLKSYNHIIKENEVNLSRQAFFDALTEIPNRKTLIDRVDILTNSPELINNPFALAFIDIDDFKKVNDTEGHHIGDLLLQYLSNKLQKAIHPDDVIGRLGGDEFGLIINHPLEHNAIFSYINDLKKTFKETIFLDDVKLSIDASFGIALYPQDGNTTTELLKHADLAMYAEKESKKAKNNYCC
jgi:diguanylate cyclase (GGDEF)-like protein